MIKVRTKSFTTEFSHPGRGVGTGYSTYVINHNLGAHITQVHAIYENSLGEWWLLEDFDRLFVGGSRYFGYSLYFDDNTTVTVRIYYISSASRTVRMTFDS